MFFKFADKGLRYWLPYYLWQQLLPKEKPDPRQPIHFFVCIVDHFEPFNGGVDYKTALERVKVWKKEYPKFADRHRDAEGNPVQHTWFYPPHLDHSLLPYLVELCHAGYGEIEMHLHHNHMKPFPDTSETLRNKILTCIDNYGKYGIFSQPDGKPRFAFIHGDWSLDNSAGCDICGVNDELTILRECGCYADFTFPCLNHCQPAMANTIYYAIDDPNAPKSYNRGIPVTVNQKPPDKTLMLIQGIIGVRYHAKKQLKLGVECSDLDVRNPPTIERVIFWVKNSIAIPGNPNWRFIKLHTHGGPEDKWDANFGSYANMAFNYLEKKYDNGEKYILHYVTARELFNIVKATEEAKQGNPHKYRDFAIPKYI